MHTGARGHEVEHRHSYFLCPKTEKKQNNRLHTQHNRKIWNHIFFFCVKMMGKTEILCLSFCFFGEIHGKRQDIFLRRENLVGLSTYIYGVK